MRNCFVPHCDYICRAHPKRMMFLPPKNQELFEVWKAMLPKKREFRKHDKVCARHFNKDDIITTFDHIIEGKLFQMERGRPRLKPNAIPCLNIPDDDVDIRKLKKAKTLQNEVAELDIEQSSIVKDDVVVQRKQKARRKTPQEPKSDLEDIETEKNGKDPKSIDLTIQIVDSDYEKFENLYEDIFEVVLPSTLWGVHRDPNRTWIAFSSFDASILATNKTVFINSQGFLKITISGKLINEQQFKDELNAVLVSSVLSEIDEARVCLHSLENENCRVLIENTISDICENCKIE